MEAPATVATVQRVMIVNGNAEMLTLLEPALEHGHYDIVVVDALEHAYSHIRDEQPNLVILCVRLDHSAEFNLLSMLKLDPATSGIPVLTYAVEYDGGEEAPSTPDVYGGEIFAPLAAPLMN